MKYFVFLLSKKQTNQKNESKTRKTRGKSREKTNPENPPAARWGCWFLYVVVLCSLKGNNNMALRG
jgi:hypothetical protein